MPKTLPNDLAFASKYHSGLSKREYFAALAMESMAWTAMQWGKENREIRKNVIAPLAVEFADALIEALNKSTDENLQAVTKSQVEGDI